jgi:phosphatidate cytidylyltransferase
MSNLTLRILSAAVMLAVGLSALTWHPISRWALVTVILSLGTWEFARMLDKHFTARPVALFASFWVACLGLVAYPHRDSGHALLAGDPGLWIWGWVIVGGLAYTLAAFRWLPIDRLAPWLFMSLFGMLFLGPWALQIHHLFLPQAGFQGISPMLMAFIGIACSDTGAYATGRLFGKRKLCPQISAKKTVEGAIGGTVIGTVACGCFGLWQLPYGPLAVFSLALGISLTSMVGDLFISVLKRFTGTKDASQLIPGHGGILASTPSFLPPP